MFLCVTATMNLYYNLYSTKKMADFEHQRLEIGLETEAFPSVITSAMVLLNLRKIPT